MTAPLNVREIDHVVLRCRDQQRTLAFYTQVLGLREERRLEAIGLVQLRAGSGLVDLVPMPAEASNAGVGNVEHFCLGVEAADMAALVRYLRDAGIETLGEVMERYGARGMGPSIYVRDPEGNVVELKLLHASNV